MQQAWRCNFAQMAAQGVFYDRPKSLMPTTHAQAEVAMQQGTAHPLSAGDACRRSIFCGRRIRSRCAGGEASQQIALQAQLHAATISLPMDAAAILPQLEQSSSRSNVPCSSVASNRAYT